MAGETSHAPREPSVGVALIQLVESGRRLVLDCIDLARFDLLALSGRALRGATLAVTGAALLAGGWFMAMAGTVVWLRQYMPLATSLGVVAVVSGVLGASAVALALRRAGSGFGPLGPNGPPTSREHANGNGTA